MYYMVTYVGKVKRFNIPNIETDAVNYTIYKIKPKCCYINKLFKNIKQRIVLFLRYFWEM